MNHSFDKPRLFSVLKAGHVLLIFALLNLSLILILPRSAWSAQVTLTWDAVADSSLQGYKIYYGIASKNYTAAVDVGNATTHALTELADGTTYYFAVTAYGSPGESAYSVELSYTTPLSASKPQSCTYALSSPGASFASSGGGGSVTVNAREGCAWSASNIPAWVNVTSGAAGTGNGTVVYVVAPNNDPNPRTVDLTIAGHVFTVTEAGLPQYTIAASATPGGRISPSGVVQVAYGANQTFTISMYPGYTLAYITVDGVSVGTVTSYTFVSVTGVHTIQAVFKRYD